MMDRDIYQDWLRYYKKAHAIKSPMKEMTSSSKFSSDTFRKFINQLNPILKNSGRFLESRGYFMKKPLWNYDREDETTWASSPRFAYGHLLEYSLFIQDRTH